MDRRIRILALLLIGCFSVLFLQLNNWQVRQSGSLAQSSFQPSASLSDTFELPRGDIVSSDGTVLAFSTPTTDGYGEMRHYPLGPLFEPVTGYYDVIDSAATGVESSYDSALLVHQSTSNNLRQLLIQHSGTDTVVLTINKAMQQAAETALAGRTGAVVAVDPQTGAVLALYGNPTFDPNGLAAHDPTKVHNFYNSLNPNSYSSPIVNWATDHPLAPGSTMKVVTTATIFDHNPTEAQKSWPSETQTTLPDTNKTLQNFGGEKCGGDLATVLLRSCDTSFAEIGLDLGGQALSDEANSFGFNTRPPIDLPPSEVAISNYPSGPSLAANRPFVAYSAIGQGNVTETALQDALIVAGIGNNGQIMTPHLLADVVDEEGNIVQSYSPKVWRNATTASTAAQVRTLMLGVVSQSGGTAAGVGFSPNLHVAAKTGTAETGLTGCSATWLIATAPAGPGDTPKIAIAAVLPQTGSGCSETGAKVAGPVVKAVMNTYFGISN